LVDIGDHERARFGCARLRDLLRALLDRGGVVHHQANRVGRRHKCGPHGKRGRALGRKCPGLNACIDDLRIRHGLVPKMARVALPSELVSSEYNVATPITVAAWAVMLVCCCAMVALCAALARAWAVA